MENKILESSDSISDYFLSDPLLFNNFTKNVVNLNKQRTQPAFRAYKDESTSAFVNTFFNDENTLNYFVYYTFQVILYSIL